MLSGRVADRLFGALARLAALLTLGLLLAILVLAVGIKLFADLVVPPADPFSIEVTPSILGA